MGNSIVTLTALPAHFRLGNPKGKITPVQVTFDVTAGDETLYTPASGNFAALVGMVLGDTTAANITFTSGSTVLAIVERAANDTPLIVPINRPILLGQVGEAFKMASSAAISDAMLYFTEYHQLPMGL